MQQAAAGRVRKLSPGSCAGGRASSAAAIVLCGECLHGPSAEDYAVVLASHPIVQAVLEAGVRNQFEINYQPGAWPPPRQAEDHTVTNKHLYLYLYLRLYAYSSAPSILWCVHSCH